MCTQVSSSCSQGTDAQLDKHVKRAPQARMSTQDTHTHTQKMTLQDLSLSQRAGPDHRHEGSFWSKERAYWIYPRLQHWHVSQATSQTILPPRLQSVISCFSANPTPLALFKAQHAAFSFNQGQEIKEIKDEFQQKKNILFSSHLKHRNTNIKT